MPDIFWGAHENHELARKQIRPQKGALHPDLAGNGVEGNEFGDTSISLSAAYQRAVLAAGGLPLALPCIASREMVAECVRRCDGVLLTGGNDVNPRLYTRQLPRAAAQNGGSGAGRARFAGIDAGGRDLPPAQAGVWHLPRPPDHECGAGRDAGGGHRQPGSGRAGPPADGQARARWCMKHG